MAIKKERLLFTEAPLILTASNVYHFLLVTLKVLNYLPVQYQYSHKKEIYGSTSTSTHSTCHYVIIDQTQLNLLSCHLYCISEAVGDFVGKTVKQKTIRSTNNNT